MNGHKPLVGLQLERKPTTSEEAGKLVDDFLLARKESKSGEQEKP